MKYLVGDGKTTIELVDNSGGLHGSAYGDSAEIKMPAKEALEPMARFAEDAIEKFKSVGDPDQVELEFGLEGGAEGGFFGLAKVHTKATIKLKATWKRKPA
ncbi:hypothetical protein HUO14_02565 [Parasphingorhabdus flavimaris]|uniref:Trypsin-co-occurring domain-containing protein n=1 Tax=Parasphingorhabdus flavimaris TaxID=266812 RepID=A0ABX2MZB9_9SPHN|nr:CU044_2847 family protein [Parasphingorhabdus flavimaris]NVD26787.1 hypothetical protein [Parasphingorhabdus flavimaris]